MGPNFLALLAVKDCRPCVLQRFLVPGHTQRWRARFVDECQYLLMVCLCVLFFAMVRFCLTSTLHTRPAAKGCLHRTLERTFLDFSLPTRARLHDGAVLLYKHPACTTGGQRLSSNDPGTNLSRLFRCQHGAHLHGETHRPSSDSTAQALRCVTSRCSLPLDCRPTCAARRRHRRARFGSPSLFHVVN